MMTPWSQLEAEVLQLPPFKAQAAPNIKSSRVLWLILKGTASFQYHGKVSRAKAGDLLWRRPGQLMNVGGADDKPVQVLALRIRHPAFALQVLADRNALQVLEAIDALSQAKGPVLRLSNAGARATSQLLHQMASVWQKPAGRRHSLLLKGLCLQLLAIFDGDDDLGSALNAPLSLAQLEAANRIAPVMRLFEDRRAILQDSWPIKRLAELCDLSPSQFHRCFRQTVGATPHVYLLSLRVLHATELLMQQDLTLVEVARRCGFSTPARLHVAFKREYGCGPGRWRKRMHASQA